MKFLSTLSLRRATFTTTTTICTVSKFLSTLSLRRATPPVRDIIQWEGIFLSTLSLRRATREKPRQTRTDTNFYPRSPCGERRHNLNLPSKPIENFYPRSPCGERLPEKSESLTTYFISIHALLAESDRPPAPPRREFYKISIHALLAESDPLRQL